MRDRPKLVDEIAIDLQIGNTYLPQTVENPKPHGSSKALGDEGVDSADVGHRHRPKG